jgi:hypothetical protein
VRRGGGLWQGDGSGKAVRGGWHTAAKPQWIILAAQRLCPRGLAGGLGLGTGGGCSSQGKSSQAGDKEEKRQSAHRQQIHSAWRPQGAARQLL